MSSILVCRAKDQPLTHESHTHSVTVMHTQQQCSELPVEHVTKMVTCNLLECMNICFIHKEFTATSKADDLQVELLDKVKGGPTNMKRVSESCAPTVHFENGVDIVDSHTLHHRANVTTLVMP